MRKRHAFAMRMSRRQFFHRGFVAAGAFAGLDSFLRTGWAADAVVGEGLADAGGAAKPIGFGDLLPDPAGIFDLPAGFSYRVISRAGERTEMGYTVPGQFDGMAAFTGPNGQVVLVRNHELDPSQVAMGPFQTRKPEPTICYDNGNGFSPGQGGTTTVVYDPHTGITIRQYMSLAGTTRNCGGGPTPWGSWISCEETTEIAGPVKGRNGAAYVNAQDHGFAFEVPASATIRIAEPVPLRAMGRFNREAVAVNPDTGLIYQTEDSQEGVLYRFIPSTPGKLREGGRLQALCLPDFKGDTTNWNQRDVSVGDQLRVTWVDIKDPLNNPAQQARAAGAARFTRGEGIWLSGERLWFVCTDGGARRKGQIWQLDLYHKANSLSLFCEPDNAHLLENGDNLTQSPWGDLLVCEDAVGDDADPGQHLVGVTLSGRPYHLGRNALNSSEMAGICCAPDGKTLFVNIQKPGLTLAITGPWKT